MIGPRLASCVKTMMYEVSVHPSGSTLTSSGVSAQVPDRQREGLSFEALGKTEEKLSWKEWLTIDCDPGTKAEKNKENGDERLTT